MRICKFRISNASDKAINEHLMIEYSVREILVENNIFELDDIYEYIRGDNNTISTIYKSSKESNEYIKLTTDITNKKCKVTVDVNINNNKYTKTKTVDTVACINYRLAKELLDNIIGV